MASALKSGGEGHGTSGHDVQTDRKWTFEVEVEVDCEYDSQNKEQDTGLPSEEETGLASGPETGPSPKQARAFN
jgi:hypothetical protein